MNAERSRPSPPPLPLSPPPLPPPPPPSPPSPTPLSSPSLLFFSPSLSPLPPLHGLQRGHRRRLDRRAARAKRLLPLLRVVRQPDQWRVAEPGAQLARLRRQQPTTPAGGSPACDPETPPPSSCPPPLPPHSPPLLPLRLPPSPPSPPPPHPPPPPPPSASASVLTVPHNLRTPPPTPSLQISPRPSSPPPPPLSYRPSPSSLRHSPRTTTRRPPSPCRLCEPPVNRCAGDRRCHPPTPSRSASWCARSRDQDQRAAAEVAPAILGTPSHQDPSAEPHTAHLLPPPPPPAPAPPARPTTPCSISPLLRLLLPPRRQAQTGPHSLPPSPDGH